MNNIMIGCPVNKNRVLPSYLEHIRNLDYPKNKLHLSFLVNNCKDDTYDILYTFREEYLNEYYDISLWNLDEIEEAYPDGNRYNKRNYEAFAKLRNVWISMMSDRDDYIFSVDSDVLIPPNSLRQLLSHDKKIISLLFPHEHDMYNIMKERTFQGRYNHIFKGSFERKLIKVAVTGGAILVHRDVLDDGVRYEYHRNGEDVAFCEIAREAGYDIYCDAGLEAKHIMRPNGKSPFEKLYPEWFKEKHPDWFEDKPRQK